MTTTLTPALAGRIRDDYAAFARAPDYPCLGARSALRTGGTRVEVYGPMGDDRTTAALARDLQRFAAAPRRDSSFVALVAMFADPAPDDEAAFERRLWTQLEQLSARDTSGWADGVSADPDDPHYAFSFGAVPYFVIGLHPESSRAARRLSWPALVFNPHVQFRRLRESGRFEGLREAVRRRDIALQGDINPNLADAGEASEARQYSGRPTNAEWRCPWHTSGETP